MIVQSAPQDSHLVIPMKDHLCFVQQVAAAFGNDTFQSLGSNDLIRFAIDHHDEGWIDVDHSLPMDPDTGLPCNLLKTPLADMVRSGPASAEFNEAHHPLCGLLISMHVYGLYNGRYGLSDKIVVDALPPQARPVVDAMLDGELKRQARLKTELESDPTMQAQIEDATLFHHYKLLQFFDTLALYFCMAHPEHRGQSTFANVPRAVGDDITITITPQANGTYQLDPFPFPGDALEVSLPGTPLRPQPAGTDIQEVMRSTPKTEERIRLVSSSAVPQGYGVVGDA